MAKSQSFRLNVQVSLCCNETAQSICNPLYADLRSILSQVGDGSPVDVEIGLLNLMSDADSTHLIALASALDRVRLKVLTMRHQGHDVIFKAVISLQDSDLQTDVDMAILLSATSPMQITLSPSVADALADSFVIVDRLPIVIDESHVFLFYLGRAL